MVSEFLALASAFCIALSSVVLAGLGNKVPLLQIARWQLTAALVFTGLLSALTGGWKALTPDQIWMLVASGLVGIGLASTTYYATIATVGARITSLLFTLAAPFSLGLGWTVLGEPVTLLQGAGVALVLAGVALAVGLPKAEERPAALGLGVVTGLVTAFGQAVGSLLARPAMASGIEPFTAMAVRTGPVVVLFLALALTRAGQRGAVPMRSRAFVRAMVSALIGTGLGMSLLMAALHRGNVGVVTTLSSVTPVLVLPMVWASTGKAPSALAWGGAALAVTGIVLIGA